MVQRMDHRERFPLQSCTDGPTNGPPGKVSHAKQHRWSNRWTTGKGFHGKGAPMVQQMDHRERFSPQSSTDGPTDGPPGKVPTAKVLRWSNGWTTGKGFHGKGAPMVQRMDHRERFSPQSSTDGPTDGPPGKVSPAKQHRWSNEWTTGKGISKRKVPQTKRCQSSSRMRAASARSWARRASSEGKRRSSRILSRNSTRIRRP